VIANAGKRTQNLTLNVRRENQKIKNTQKRVEKNEKQKAKKKKEKI
jgi:hypothetical protein